MERLVSSRASIGTGRGSSALLFVGVLLGIAPFAGCSAISDQVAVLTSKIPPALRLNSLSRKVRPLLAEARWAEARTKLDEEGVGQPLVPSSARDVDYMEARRLFQERIEEEFLSAGRRAFDEGRPREAVRRLDEGLLLCPWSESLRRLRADTQMIVTELNAIEYQLRSALEKRSSDQGLEPHRGALRRAAPRRTLLRDSPAAAQAVRVLESDIVSAWVDIISAPDTFRALDPLELQHDLALLKVSDRDRAGAMRQVRASRTLADLGSSAIRDPSFQGTLLLALRWTPEQNLTVIEPLFAAVRARLVDVATIAVEQESRAAAITYSTLVFVEQLLELLPNESQRLSSAAAAGHVARARHLATAGRAAALALLHLHRARDLGVRGLDYDQLRSVAEASFVASGHLPLHVKLETNPSDDPILQDLARLAVAESIRRRSRPHVRVRIVDENARASDVHVSIESIMMLVPSFADLHSVTSQYLSHFEEIPNPRKAHLKHQLDLQRISVDITKSSYNTAVSSFNIYPTEFGLTSVNIARTRYNQEVDQYNFLVNLYNATSATVTRPVHLSYTFQEGIVRHGWRLSGTVSVGAVKDTFVAEAVDSDFVRIGARRDDLEVKYRREDRLDIDVSTDRLITQLASAVDSIAEKVAQLANGMRVEQLRVQLSDSEQALLAALLHPLASSSITGPAPKLGWGRDDLTQFALPPIADARVPPVKLTAPTQRVVGGSAAEIAAFYGPAVALISTKGGSSGSGALISPDGLVLTAAHVLRSESIEIAFPGGGVERRYRGELVFVNELHDVAIVRAVGYNATRWFEIAVTEAPERGDPVVAIGNPSVGGAGIAVNAVSSGIVAKPYEGANSPGLKGLVADITISSGSSGGPLISQKTGRIIGVVTAVVAPTVSRDFAASGYWAVSAPSAELPKWLGVVYGQ
jgi:S1-C subfamily serine protease